MLEKIKELGALVGEIEKISPQYCKKLIQSYPSRFFSFKQDFVSAYLRIIEDAIKFEVSPVDAIVSADELANFLYDREQVRFNFNFGFFQKLAENERKRIGEKIAEIRKQKGLSQSDLAVLTNMQQGNIARIEKGQYSTGTDILSKIAFSLDVTVDFL